MPSFQGEGAPKQSLEGISEELLLQAAEEDGAQIRQATELLAACFQMAKDELRLVSPESAKHIRKLLMMYKINAYDGKARDRVSTVRLPSGDAATIGRTTQRPVQQVQRYEKEVLLSHIPRLLCCRSR